MSTGTWGKEEERNLEISWAWAGEPWERVYVCAYYDFVIFEKQNFQRAEVNLYWSHQLKFYVYHRWWCDATSPYDVNVNINHKNDFTSKKEAILIHHIIWSTDIHVGIGTRDRIVQFGKSFMTRLCWRCCCYYWASANTFNHYHYKSTSCLFGNYINFHRVFHSISFAFWCFRGKRILTDAHSIWPRIERFYKNFDEVNQDSALFCRNSIGNLPWFTLKCFKYTQANFIMIFHCRLRRHHRRRCYSFENIDDD